MDRLKSVLNAAARLLFLTRDSWGTHQLLLSELVKAIHRSGRLVYWKTYCN